jgi:hypothetical protein
MAFGSEQWMYASGGFYPHEIGNSARLDNGALLTRTPSSSSNADTWTWSAWVKNWGVTTGGYLLSAGVASTREFLIYFDGTNQRLNVYQWNGGIEIQVVTSMQFRDPSAWYHIVVAYDSPQATASNRLKIYVNGEQQTDFASAQYPAQGLGSRVGTTEVQDIGRNAYNQNVYSNFYITEVNYISGSQLAPTSFGETKAGTWIPKKYAGSYGSHDYYLPFNDAGFLGKDASTVLGSELVTNGTFDTNINNWTAHNGATLAFSNNRLSVFKNPLSSNAGAYQAISVQSGSTYSVEATVDKGTTNGARVGIEYTLGGRDGVETSSNTGGHFQFNFTSSTTGTVYVRCFIQAPNTAYFDNISVKEITTQGNDFTSTNLLVSDQVPDSPTNNWATLNPLGPMRHGANYGMGTQTQGNLTVASTSQSYFDDTNSTIYVPDQKKWYYEIRMDQLDMGSGVGYVQFNIGGVYLRMWYGASSNTQIVSGSTYNYAAMSNGDILMVAIDEDNSKGWFGLNGTWYTTSGTPDPAAGTGASSTSGTGMIGRVQIRSGTGTNIVTANFGQDSSFAGQATAQGNTDANGLGDFYYAPPAGYLALCSANMPDPPAAFNPALDASPQDHFNTVLYTGNGSTDRDITGVGFQPDWVWIKKRNAAKSHNLFDVLRGAGKMLETNSTIGDFIDTDRVNGFISDGFNLGNDNAVNNSGDTYVAWNWKASNSAGYNNDGTIQSIVSANTDAGFSVVAYTVPSGGGFSVGHGLNSTPKIILSKNRDTTSNWDVYSEVIGNTKRLMLNLTNAPDTQPAWNNTTPTSSVFYSVGGGSWHGVGSRIINYVFSEVEGFSKIGSYTGNGSADGPFIYTGFRPAFVMIKNASSSSQPWGMFDNRRVGYNEVVNYFQANSSDAEVTSIGGVFYGQLDFVSNGFKIRETDTFLNGSGNTLIYMAFAEMPFKYANAR